MKFEAPGKLLSWTISNNGINRLLAEQFMDSKLGIKPGTILWQEPNYYKNGKGKESLSLENFYYST